MAASAGDMRHSVVVKNTTRTSDGGGGYVDGSTSSDTVFCAIRQLSAKEIFSQGRNKTEGEWEFICRKPSTEIITGRSKLEYDSKVFNVVSVLNTDERDKYLVIKAEEGVAL